MSDEILDDLRDKLEDKLGFACRDFMQLCDAADISFRDAAKILSIALIKELSILLYTTRVSPETCGNVVAKTIAAFVEMRNER